MTGSIMVINGTEKEIFVFVSKYSGGDDTWLKLDAGGRESWARSGWELVAFRDANDDIRAGVYVPVNSVVTFFSFKHITVL